jgi:hypothetical protein
LKKKNQRQEEEPSERRAKPLLLLVLCIGLFSPSLFASQAFFSPATSQAQALCYELKLDSAFLIIHREIERNPDDLAPYLIKHLALSLKAFVSEQDADRQALYNWHKGAKHRFAISSSKSPYRKFGMAEMNFHMALIKGKAGAQMDAAMHLNQAYKQLKSNYKQFPDFKLNNKNLGIINAYLAAVPDSYQWAIKVLGFRGSFEKGLDLLSNISYAEQDLPHLGHFPLEASYLYAFTLTHVKHDADEAQKVLDQCADNCETSLLSSFFHANVAFKRFDNRKVIETLAHRPQGEAYEHFYLLEYMLGSAYLYDLDARAVLHLNTYLKEFQGPNFKKVSLMKRSWYHLINGEQKQAEADRQAITAMHEKAVNEEDKLAENYTEKALPNTQLLKTRLLFDGGQFQRALDLIKDMSHGDFPDIMHKTEYCYRKARIYEELDQWTLALPFYEAASQYGMQSPEYYGAYACLKIADRFLSLGNKTLSMRYYKKAQTYHKNQEFTDTVALKAKAGIRASRD